ncbi:viral dsdna helicase [Caudoviricetes sp.]|nr:viral dsdna helicase [Caudoviricetes sp.]
MLTTVAFINLGWHTVPLSGQLDRLPSGKKTTPIFPQNWKEIYSKTRNTSPTSLGGVITGSVSNIIAIDCDNTAAYNLVRSLDPTNTFVFKSLGKKDAEGNPIEAATFIYQYTDDCPQSYKLHNDILAIDFLSNSGFAYLPTAANTTKIAWADTADPLPQPPVMPLSLVTLIQSLKPQKPTAQPAHDSLAYSQPALYLAPQLKTMADSKKPSYALFKTITPRDFRDMPEYIRQGYLLPDQVPDGRGSEYLSKVSAILGADSSVNETLYASSMQLINNMFSKPMPRAQLDSTIIEPMALGRASIDGVPIWKYNPNWEDNKLIYSSKWGDTLDVFFDSQRELYYCVNNTSLEVKDFSKDEAIVAYLESITRDNIPKKAFKQQIPLVSVISSPTCDYGFHTPPNGRTQFNSFTPSYMLSVFKNPKAYAHKYRYPKTIVNFLNTLIPDHMSRNYLLQFLRRKFDKFEYSPAIIYLLGVSGAGKDTLVGIIERMIGPTSMARPSADEFLEHYNGWLLDKYFAQLDEYGNQLVRYDQKESALGKLKAYTGKSEVQIRQMRNDGYNYHHSCTFIMTANKNPLFLDADDRRVALFACPNILKDADWVINAGGVGAVQQQIVAEHLDFAYMLATEVDNLDLDDYMCPPESADKRTLIASKLNAGDHLVYLLKNCMFRELEETATVHGITNLFDHAADGKIYEDALYELYSEMTDQKGTRRGLTGALRDFHKVPTTKSGLKSYYYVIPNLKGFSTSPFKHASLYVDTPPPLPTIELAAPEPAVAIVNPDQPVSNPPAIIGL